MATDNPVPDDGALPDPFEVELVAYLDGELDADAARKVEARLQTDPDARARAEALKKSYDLLDYLPRPEPSPTFTTRTLEKLPALKPLPNGTSPPAPAGTSSSTPRDGQPTSQPPATERPQPAVATSPTTVSSSMPIPLETGALSLPLPVRPRRGVWVAGVLAAVIAFTTIGYFATAAIRPYLFPSPTSVQKEPEEPKLEVDARVIENLPLYAVADDLAFVRELVKPDYFGEEPAVSYDASLRIPPGDISDKPTGKEFESLARAFRALPATRQAEIAKLDEQLQALEAKERDRLLRVLEVYAAWLERLPDAERRGVLSAATPNLRLEVIREVRKQQWIDALPPPLRKQLDMLTNAKEKAALIQQWKDEEAIRRDRWAFIRQHAKSFADNKSPWPFDTEAGRKEVLDFARVAFKPDNFKQCRLSLAELGEYKRTLELAQRDGAWAWYGLTVYELSKLHPYLPEPADNKLLITDLNDLPAAYLSRVFPKKGFVPRYKFTTIGKWPEFPLEVLDVVKDGPSPKGGFPPMPPLGPSRLNEFKEPVRTFATKELFPKMRSTERFALRNLEGKWPDYARALIDYATKHDLSVPGAMLPGSPKRWDTTYGIRAGNRP